jgi:hypothetical protein
MTSQTDKLFREKLENFQRPASVAAWDRIESGLNKNQSKGIWLKFAAGISMFAVATYLLWPTEPIENQQASNTNPVAPKTENAEKTTSEKITPTIVKENPTSQKAITKNKSIKKDEPVLTAEATKEIKVETPVAILEPTEVQVAVAETNTIETAPSKTIVYTAEEVNAKFLRKKSPSEATVSPEKSSGIQKLMGLAYTLKNPDNGIGDLRQKKDEILALNFLSTKEDKTNNEKN